MPEPKIELINYCHSNQYLLNTLTFGSTTAFSSYALASLYLIYLQEKKTSMGHFFIKLYKMAQNNTGNKIPKLNYLFSD